jgi:hypothetical protein
MGEMINNSSESLIGLQPLPRSGTTMVESTKSTQDVEGMEIDPILRCYFKKDEKVRY